ncbi:MAG: single-stranded-DNA-specific exonuclease RecJ, partial [Ezakiella sp.]
MLEKWFLRNKNNAQSPDRSLNLLERTKLRILYNRDITEIDDMKKYFLNPYEAMYDANLFNDFHILYDRLITLKENNETVAIVGDYDVDGIMSTTILLKTFKRLGISVTYKIPNRMTDGYGINRRIVDELKLEGVSLIITVDNGIQACDVLEYAKELGLDVFITDHHELKVEDEEFMIPESIGAINPHRPDSNYPFQLLCGAGIAYKVAILLLKKFGQYDPELDRELITLAGIATICDVVDLVDENRIIAYHGLLNYRETTNIGLRAITKVASVDIKKVDSYHIGFIIGPRFNSSGRLKTADLGIELLTTDNE